MAAFEAMGDVIVKPLFGSNGKGMVRVSDADIAYRVFKALELERAVYYVQQALPHEGRDLRVFVVGDRVVAAAWRSAAGWRTNVARGGEARRAELSPAWEQMSLRAARAVGAGYAGVDLLPTPDGQVFVLEVNGIPGWRGLQGTTDVDVADAIVGHLEDRARSRRLSHVLRRAEVVLFAQAACLLEASAAKPGNVSPGRDFHDTRFEDFVLSALAIGPALARAPEAGVGTTVLDAVRDTRRVVSVNTNLGIVLLLAPLVCAASSPEGGTLRSRLSSVLAGLTVADAQAVHAAIRLVNPGGLGEAETEDVRLEPTRTLRETMGLAAERDTIAREYVTDYDVTFRICGSGLASRAGRRTRLGLRRARSVPGDPGRGSRHPDRAQGRRARGARRERPRAGGPRVRRRLEPRAHPSARGLRRRAPRPGQPPESRHHRGPHGGGALRGDGRGALRGRGPAGSMRILVHEFVSGGGLAGRPVTASLAREGAAMRNALVADLAALRRHHIVTTVDRRFPLRRTPAGVEVVTLTATRPRLLDELLASVDAVWLVAPETGGCLERLAARAVKRGAVLLGPSAAAIRSASDKAGLAKRLSTHGVPHPETRLVSSIAQARTAATGNGPPGGREATAGRRMRGRDLDKGSGLESSHFHGAGPDPAVRAGHRRQRLPAD